MCNAVFHKSIFEDLDKYSKNLGKHIYVIKYEMITPDMSILCFRTTNTVGEDHFFAYLSFDYMNTIKYGKKVINKHFSKVIEFIAPRKKQKGRTELEQKRVTNKKGMPYSLLARTDRPLDMGYWSSYVKFLPGDAIDEKLAELSAPDQTTARRALVEIFRNNLPDEKKSNKSDFLKSWENKASRFRLQPKDLITNDTGLEINLFRNVAGEWEAFYK